MSKNSSVLNTNTNKVRYPQFEYKFKIEIRESTMGALPNKPKYALAKLIIHYYAVLVAGNNEVVFVGKMRTRKSGVIKTAKRLFGEGVTIIDKTK